MSDAFKNRTVLILSFVVVILIGISILLGLKLKKSNTVKKPVAEITHLGAYVDSKVARLHKQDYFTNNSILYLKTQLTIKTEAIAQLNLHIVAQSQDIERLQINIKGLQRQIDELRAKVDMKPSIVEKRIYVYPPGYKPPCLPKKPDCL